MLPQTVDLEVRDPRLTEIIALEAVLEPLATGFQFLEGPVWLPDARALVFSDIPGDTMYLWANEASPIRNRGFSRSSDQRDKLSRSQIQAQRGSVTPDRRSQTGLEHHNCDLLKLAEASILVTGAGIVGATVFRQPSHKANGNTLDRQGRLLTCEHVTSRVVRQEADGRLTVLASHYAGQELNSPNDIVVKRDGPLYFTDPNFGRRPTRFGVPRAQQQPCQGVYRLNPETGALIRLVDDFDQPNGLCFSLDERHLFVNDSPRGHIRVFKVKEDGALTGGEVWAELRGVGPGVPDGMKLDAAGNLYCAGPGGIHIFAPDAACLGVIRLPEQAANFCWGGDDLRDLFICASTTLWRVRTQVAGLPATR